MPKLTYVLKRTAAFPVAIVVFIGGIILTPHPATAGLLAVALLMYGAFYWKYYRNVHVQDVTVDTHENSVRFVCHDGQPVNVSRVLLDVIYVTGMKWSKLFEAEGNTSLEPGHLLNGAVIHVYEDDLEVKVAEGRSGRYDLGGYTETGAKIRTEKRPAASKPWNKVVHCARRVLYDPSGLGWELDLCLVHAYAGGRSEASKIEWMIKHGIRRNGIAGFELKKEDIKYPYLIPLETD